MARGIDTYLDLRTITRCVVMRSGDDSCPLLQQAAFSQSRHFDPDIFPANTVIYDRLLHYCSWYWHSVGIFSNLALCLCIHSLRCYTDAPPLQPLSAVTVS